MVQNPPLSEEKSLSLFQQDLPALDSSTLQTAAESVIIAALSAIPWFGSVVAALASFRAETRNKKREDIQNKWLKAHEEKANQLVEAIKDLLRRFEQLGDGVAERIASPEYISLVRAAFRTWDRAETDDKRKYAARLIANAAGSNITSDDVLRLFISWIENYHEMHFAVIGAIYKTPGATRLSIWHEIKGLPAREDTPEAGLFRFLIRDLSTGGIIRQHRAKNAMGEFVQKQPRPRRAGEARKNTTTSAFDDQEKYELSELGQQFVHYTLNEVVPRLE